MKHRIFIVIMAIYGIVCDLGHSTELNVVTEDYPPFQYRVGQNVRGLSTEVVVEVLNRAKVKYDIQVYPWSKAYRNALTYPNMLIYSIARSEERESHFQWIGTVAPLRVYMYRLKKRADIQLKQLMDAKNYKIGVVNRDVRHQYLEEQGFLSGPHLDVTSNDILNLKKLFNNNIDLMPIDEIGINSILTKIGRNPNELERAFFIEELSLDLYMACSLKTDPQIIKDLRDAWNSMQKDGTYDAIHTRFFR